MKRRLPLQVKQPLGQQPVPNIGWSMDFMSDSLACGRRFRTFNVVDDHNREVLAIDMAVSIEASRVIRTLNQVIKSEGLSKVSG